MTFWKHKTFRFAIKSLLTIGVLIWLWKSQSWEGVWGSVISADPILLSAALAMGLLTIPLQAWRWKILLEGKGIDCSLKILTNFTAIGYFANIFLPSSIGGDAVKSVYLGKKLNRMGASIASTLLGRVLGVYTLLITFWFFTLLAPSKWFLLDKEFLVVGFISAGAVFLAALYFYHGTFQPKTYGGRYALLNRFFKLLEDQRFATSIVVKAWGASLIIQLTNLFFGYWVFLSLFPEVDFIGAFIAMPLMLLIGMVPITIFNVGIKESLAIYYMGRLAGLPDSASLAGILISYVMALIQAAVGLVFWLKGSQSRHEQQTNF